MPDVEDNRLKHKTMTEDATGLQKLSKAFHCSPEFCSYCIEPGGPTVFTCGHVNYVATHYLSCALYNAQHLVLDYGTLELWIKPDVPPLTQNGFETIMMKLGCKMEVIQKQAGFWNPTQNLIFVNGLTGKEALAKDTIAKVWERASDLEKIQ